MSAVRRRFRPGFWPSLATIILFPLFIRLGFWQLERAQLKHHMVDAFEQRMSMPALDLNSHLPLSGDHNYRHAKVNGTYDNRHQVFLDNKIYEGVPGYQVLTPMHINHSHEWILVNRGWLPMGKTRTQLPNIEIKQQRQIVDGQLYKPSRGVFTLGGGNLWTKKWPQIIQWLEPGEFSSQLQHQFVPYVLLLSKDVPEGYVRDWHPAMVNPQRSESYAVQWFSFAAILLGLYIFLNYKKEIPEVVRSGS